MHALRIAQAVANLAKVARGSSACDYPAQSSAQIGYLAQGIAQISASYRITVKPADQIEPRIDRGTIVKRRGQIAC